MTKFKDISGWFTLCSGDTSSLILKLSEEIEIKGEQFNCIKENQEFCFIEDNKDCNHLKKPSELVWIWNRKSNLWRFLKRTWHKLEESDGTF